MVRYYCYAVDTQTSRLDRILWPAFLAWNGDAGPVFAGRNFLGGDFIWVSPEAPTTLATPSPTDPTLLETATDYIAPFQAKDSTRQKVTSDLGRSYGQIDGTARYSTWPRPYAAALVGCPLGRCADGGFGLF